MSLIVSDVHDIRKYYSIHALSNVDSFFDLIGQYGMSLVVSDGYDVRRVILSTPFQISNHSVTGFRME